jgi:hypothetical protein
MFPITFHRAKAKNEDCGSFRFRLVPRPLGLTSAMFISDWMNADGEKIAGRVFFDFESFMKYAEDVSRLDESDKAYIHTVVKHYADRD